MTTGSYLEIDGRPALRFVRDYPHPPERVWEAVTDPTELAAWFPARVAFPGRGTPTAGGEVRYSFDEDGDGGAGTVVVHEPPHRLTITLLDDEQIGAIAAAITAIEEHYGHPVDVEWVIGWHRRAGDPVCIVQTRPVTTAAPEPAASTAPPCDPVALAQKYLFSGRPIPGR